jgi:hypothetical protein
MTTIQFVSAALAPRPKKKPSSSRLGLSDIQRDAAAPTRIIYGTVRTSGVLAFADTTDKDGVETNGAKYFHSCLLMADGPIQSIYDVQFNGASMDDPMFADKAIAIPFLGTTDQEAIDPKIKIGSTEISIPKTDWNGGDLWTAKHRLRGIAYLWMCMEFNAESFPSGAPNITATIDGRLVYDPRDGTQSSSNDVTWAWSNNWVLCVLDFLTSTRYGMGISIEEFDLVQIAAEADYCDQPVDIPQSLLEANSLADPDPVTTQARYTIDGVWETTTPRIEVLTSLLASAAGSISFVQGKWQIRCGRPYESEMYVVGTGGELNPQYDGEVGELTEDDICGSISVLPKPGRKGKVNAIKGTFIDPQNQWVSSEFPKVVIDQYVKEDGGHEYVQDVDFPFINDVYRAQRVAQIHLKRMRQGIVCEAVAKPKKITVKEGDVLGVTSTTFGWGVDGDSPKEFLVQDWRFSEDAGVTLKLTEYSDSVYAWTEQDAIVGDAAPDTSLANPFTCGTPTNLVAVEATHVQPDGKRTSKIVLDWDAPADRTHVGHYHIRLRKIGEPAASASHVKTAGRHYEFRGMEQGMYRIYVWTVNQMGVQSIHAARAYVSTTILTIGPPDVTSFLFSIQNGARVFEWSMAEPEPSDLVGYQIRYRNGLLGTDPNTEWEDASNFLTVKGNKVSTPFPNAPGEYTFYIRALDAQGFLSDNTTAIVVEVQDTLHRNIVRTEEASEMNWPGTLVRCRRSTEGGALFARGVGTWADAGGDEHTWGTFPRWPISANAFSYTHEIDLGTDTNVSAVCDISSENAFVFVFARGRSATGEFGVFQPLGDLGDVRFVEFRMVGWRQDESQMASRINRMAMYLVENAVREVANDCMSTVPDGVGGTSLLRAVSYRIEYTSEWNTGTHGNTHVLEHAFNITGDGESGAADTNQKPKACLCPEHDPSLYLDETAEQGAFSSDAPHLRLPGSWTVEIKVRPLSWLSSGVLVGKGPDWRIRYGMAGNGVIDFCCVGHSGDDPQPYSMMNIGNEGFAPTTIAYTYDAIDEERGLFRGYLDGVLQFEKDQLAFTINPSDSLFMVGAGAPSGPAPAPGTVSDYFSGIVEEIRVWNYARSKGDVAADCWAVHNGTETGLVGYWPCSEEDGEVIWDLTKNAMHMATMQSPARVRYCTWLPPPFNCDVIQCLMSARLNWQASGGLEAFMAVHVKLAHIKENGTEEVTHDWTSMEYGGEACDGELPFEEFQRNGALHGEDLFNYRVYARIFIVAEVGEFEFPRPYIRKFKFRFGTRCSSGDFTYIPKRRFRAVTTAMVSAIQGTAAGESIAVARIVAREPYGVRVKLFDAQTGQECSGKVDLSIEGPSSVV